MVLEILNNTAVIRIIILIWIALIRFLRSDKKPSGISSLK
jgi:hypothetical protein